MNDGYDGSDPREELLIYRCTECGKVSVSIGWLHAHIEKHHGFGPWNIIPNPLKMGRFKPKMEYTEILRVDEYSEVGLEEVKARG